MADRPRVRMRFRKLGALRWIGHRDLARLWERLFRRAGIRLAHSQGFHPKPKISFPLALAVGMESFDEVMEVELTEPCNAEALWQRLRAQAPPGLEIADLQLLPPETPKARVRAVSYRIAVPADRQASVSRWMVQGEGVGGGELVPECVGDHPTVREALEAIRWQDGQLEFTLRVLPQGLPTGREVLHALDLGDLETQGAVLIRTRVELEASVSSGGRRARS